MSGELDPKELPLKKGDLLDALARAEVRLRDDLLDESEDWSTLNIDYEPPRVERLWRQHEAGFRICLHRIHPCERALFHPHPWPSAIKILSGTYEMGVGFGSGQDVPKEAATIRLTAGATYEMIEPDGWHYVRPIGEPSLSLMVTGLPWERWSPHPQGKLEGLPAKERDKLLDIFRAVYWN